MWSTTYMAYGMMVFAVLVVLMLVFSTFTATYGRYAHQTVIPGTMPARLAWFLQELPAFAIPVYVLASGECSMLGANVNTLVLAMFTVHYAQRVFLYPMLIRGGKSTPVHIMMSATAFCAYNGCMQTVHHCEHVDYDDDDGHWRRVVGGLVFVLGFIVNQHSDHILRTSRAPGETGYKIPRGGLFTYVTGANFLGEMVEWLGYALVANTAPAWAFALSTACNIGPRAFEHHRWYRRTFGDDYPVERRALIPFLW